MFFLAAHAKCVRLCKAVSYTSPFLNQKVVALYLWMEKLQLTM